MEVGGESAAGHGRAGTGAAPGQGGAPGVRPARSGARMATIPRRVCAAGLFAALTALGAHLAVPLPGTPVPFTLQPVAVLLAGFLLGPRLGAASQAVYLAAGMAGLPVFAAGGGAAYLLGPTGGYLLAFPAAAAIAGWFAWRTARAPLRGAGLVLALAAVHAGGAAWLAITTGSDSVLQISVMPFLAGDLLKVILTFLVGSRLLPISRRLLGPTG